MGDCVRDFRNQLGFPHSVHQIFLGKIPKLARSERKWKAAPLCLVSTEWHKRTRVAFENEAFSAQDDEIFHL